MWIDVRGTQGHVAYPHLADNPIPRLLRILCAIEAITLDEGNDWFQPSNIEITDICVGNDATNVIPAAARARISIRFNDMHTGAGLEQRIRAIVETEGGTLEAKISGEAFLTPPGDFSALVSAAIESVTGGNTRTFDHRRHLRRAVPLATVPGGGIRPLQRNDAQAR
jgi:succinyl-diaminopimelate desuccinylase